MASVEENLRYWDDVYDWSDAGDEWSRGWGGSEAMWEASVWPRISRFFPAPTVLEIAPGYGRFSAFLKDRCQNYLGVDLSPKCVAACQARFPDPHCQFFANDGRTLPMIADHSVDFIFSYFSLIHAEPETLLSYLREFAQKLRLAGGGFVHHSNLAEHGAYFDKVGRLPAALRRRLFDWGLVDLAQWRARSVSAEVFADCCRQAGLSCITQETVNFGSRRTIDCFSSFVRADGPFAAPTAIWRNPSFMHEAMGVRLGSARRLPGRVPEEYYGPLRSEQNS